MKKRTVISLIVAAALLVSGGALILAGLWNADFDFTAEPTYKTYSPSGSVQSIQINTEICNVKFFKAEGALTVHCPEMENFEHIVLIENGTLKISTMDMRQWYDLIGIHMEDVSISVYLPENQYDSLHIQSDTGDIRIPQDFAFDAVKLNTDTGDIDFAAEAAETLITETSTGSTKIHGAAPAYLECRSSSGDMVLENICISGDIHIQRSTGRITATDVTCRDFICKSNTGNTSLANVLAAGTLQIRTSTGKVTAENTRAEAFDIRTSTGDVRLNSCDGELIQIETSTGDVTGSFLTPKWFITDTSTGDVSVPLSREGGECHITTGTGDIAFQ